MKGVVLSETASDRTEELIVLTADIVSAHVSHNNVGVNDLPKLIAAVHGALAGLGVSEVEDTALAEPAIAIRSSVKPDYIVCLEDGKKLKMLKRYLMTRFGMTPDDYRAKWNLPASYPMVAPNYSAQRKTLALAIGLGRQRSDDAAEVSHLQPARSAPIRKPRTPKNGAKPVAASRGRPKAAADSD